MARVLLRPEERPAVPFEPRRLLLAITTEYEGLRALLVDRRDIEAKVIVAQARSCARTLLQFALAVRRAEKPSQARPRPTAGGLPAASASTCPTLAVDARDVLPLTRPAPCRRRCRKRSLFFFPGL